MRLLVDRRGGLSARRIDQTVHTAGALVVPILEVTNAMGALHREIPRMCTFNRLGGQCVDLMMYVHVQRHILLPADLLTSVSPWCSPVKRKRQRSHESSPDVDILGGGRTGGRGIHIRHIT